MLPTRRRVVVLGRQGVGLFFASGTPLAVCQPRGSRSLRPRRLLLFSRVMAHFLGVRYRAARDIRIIFLGR